METQIELSKLQEQIEMLEEVVELLYKQNRYLTDAIEEYKVAQQIQMDKTKELYTSIRDIGKQQHRQAVDTSHKLHHIGTSWDDFCEATTHASSSYLHRLRRSVTRKDDIQVFMKQ
jgi:hypothetical protein